MVIVTVFGRVYEGKQIYIVLGFSFRHVNFIMPLRNPREERVINLEVICM